MSFGNIEPRTGRRDKDLALASEFGGLFNPSDGDFFVLTGSYAIEAVTNNPKIEHNDIDVNIFTADRKKSLLVASRRLGRLNIDLARSTESRLEYSKEGSLIELQFVQYVAAYQTGDGVNFRVALNQDNEATVPTVEATLRNTDLEDYRFRVKTLPFAIGTWALRISGFAQDQKRTVRQSDVDHFALLVQSTYDRSQVVEAISHHPQMPPGFKGDVGDVLDVALEVVSKNGTKYD